MSPEQLGACLAAAEQHERRYLPYLLTLARTGLRPGEGLGLQWTDLDFAAREIRVERALSAGRVETPKTGEGRTVDMSAQLALALRRLGVDRKAETLRRGWGEVPPWVFCSEAGTPLDLANADKAFKRALKKAGLPSFRLYDLRHTFASQLLAEGAPIPTWPPSSATPNRPQPSSGMPDGCPRGRSGWWTPWTASRPRGMVAKW